MPAAVALVHIVLERFACISRKIADNGQAETVIDDFLRHFARDARGKPEKVFAERRFIQGNMAAIVRIPNIDEKIKRGLPIHDNSRFAFAYGDLPAAGFRYPCFQRESPPQASFSSEEP